MLKLGLIGYPLTNSLLSVIHKIAIKESGIEGDYAMLGTKPEKLDTMLNFIKKSGFRGFNVTTPHKVSILNYLDEIDKLAVKVGTVNTVVIENNGRWAGHNTDVYGFMKAIPPGAIMHFKGKKAAVIGAGDATKAVTVGMAEMGISEIHFIVAEFDVNTAFEIGQSLCKNYPLVKTHCSILKENTDLSGISLVVNATPVGMEGMKGLLEGISPLSEFSIDSLNDDTLVYDLIYRPRGTELLKLADKKGLETLEGLEMLVQQGARSFNLWTGKDAPVEKMRSSIINL